MIREGVRRRIGRRVSEPHLAAPERNHRSISSGVRMPKPGDGWPCGHRSAIDLDIDRVCTADKLHGQPSGRRSKVGAPCRRINGSL